jgi:peptidyl-prolyl cis-trans isomerase D
MRALRQSGLGQIFFGGIVVSIIAAFVLQSRTGGSANFESECAVQVGKKCVDPKEYFAAYGLVSSIGLNEKAVKQLALQEKVARGLAEREVLLEEANRLGIAASEAAVDEELLEGRTHVSLPVDGAGQLARYLALCYDGPRGCEPGTVGLRALPVKKDGQFDFERYKKVVRVATSRSPNHFKEMQQRELTAERVREVVRSQVHVSEEEAYLALDRLRSEATARVVRVRGEWFERYFSAPKSEDLEKWSKEHEKELTDAVAASSASWTEGCPVVSEIRLEANGDETEDALLARAKQLALTVTDAGSFEKTARAESKAASAHLGGRIGCLNESYGTGGPELLEVAKLLKKPGALSEPVKTVTGVTLLRLAETVTKENKDSLVREFETYKLTSAALGVEAARAFAAEVLALAKSGGSLEKSTEEKLSAWLEKRGATAKDHPALLSDLRPKSEITSSFSAEGNPLPDAAGSVNAAALVFALEKPDAVVEDLVPLTAGFAVLQLKEKDLYSREKFKSDRAAALAQLRAAKAEEVLAKYVARLLEKAGGVTLNPKYVPPSEAEKTAKGEKKSAG